MLSQPEVSGMYSPDNQKNPPYPGTRQLADLYRTLGRELVDQGFPPS